MKMPPGLIFHTLLILSESGTLRRALLATLAWAKRVVMSSIMRLGILSGGMMKEANEMTQEIKKVIVKRS